MQNQKINSEYAPNEAEEELQKAKYFAVKRGETTVYNYLLSGRDHFLTEMTTFKKRKDDIP